MLNEFQTLVLSDFNNNDASPNVFSFINPLLLLFVIIVETKNYKVLGKTVSFYCCFADQQSIGVCPTGASTKTFTRTTSPNSVVFSIMQSSN